MKYGSGGQDINWDQIKAMHNSVMVHKIWVKVPFLALMVGERSLIDKVQTPLHPQS